MLWGYDGEELRVWRKDSGPVGSGTKEILGFTFQAFFRFFVVSRLPGDPLGPLRRIKGTPAAVSGDKPPGQNTHFWKWPRFRIVSQAEATWRSECHGDLQALIKQNRQTGNSFRTFTPRSRRTSNKSEDKWLLSRCKVTPHPNLLSL